MRKPTTMLALILLLAVTSFAQSSPMPDWLRAHMDYMTQGTGTWVTSNDRFKSESEPFEAYATEWQYGVGKQSLKGRLYGIRDGKPTSDFWEYHVFWHPAEKKAYFYQIGAGGAVGIGEMKDSGEDDPPQRLLEMVMTLPSGNSLEDLHRFYESEGEHKTVSYDFKDNEWVERRTYVWKLKK